VSELEPDDGHLFAPAAWQAVVDDAEAQAVRIAAGHGAELEQHGLATGLLPLSGVVNAPSNGGRRVAGAPTFGVLHTAETPLRAGYAAAIARYFAGGPGTSCHYMTDPAESWGVLDDSLVAWHCGTGNLNSIALEQAGRAAMTRAEWLVPDGYAQLRRNALIMRAARARYGIGLYWMTDAQLLAAHRRQIVGGWATHDQCRRVLGGTTHTDPGGGFPLDVQMTLANGDIMATLDAEDIENIKRAVYGAVWGLPGMNAAGVPLVPREAAMTVTAGEEWPYTALASLPARVDRIVAARLASTLDPKVLGAAVAAELPSGGGQVTQEALEAALRNVLGSLA